MKLPVLGALPLGGQVAVTGTHGAFSALAGYGYVFSAHLAPLAEPAPDFVAIAEAFLNAPYLWGGKTFGGIDCSGLVQAACRACGIACPADSDQQLARLGRLLADDEPLRRGDLVFWKGHVALMSDAETILHANGAAMAVTREPYARAVTRILAAGEGPVIARKRL